MFLFKRREVILELLNSLDIPRFGFFYESYNGIGPNDPEFFDKYEDRRKEREEAAKIYLENGTDEELWDLSETPHSLESFAQKFLLFDPPPWYAGGFGVQCRIADFEYWAKMGFWTLEEATCLSIGFNPEPMPEKKEMLQYTKR